MAWTNLSFAYGSVLTSTKMTQMYDNFAYGAGSTSPVITLADTSTAVTQAVGDNSTKLATTSFCEAGFVNNDVGAGAIGSIQFANHSTGSGIATNATVAGSALYGLTNDSSGILLVNATALSGTWRNISAFTCNAGTIAAGNNNCAHFQRIS